MPSSSETNLPTASRKASTGAAPSMSTNDNGFIRSKLPWIIGAGALVIFLITLNQWVSLRSLGMVARVTGWDVDLPVQWPIFFTVTFPFRFLPAAIQPIALNFFTALCAALTVALLARSIALLPQDRTHEQRIRERSEFSFLTIRFAWAPMVLACGALALQLTFWENATSVTGEMLDLLLFAYVIRCLLEYRVAHEESWLSKMAFVYGLAITNNWAMIGFFPLFLGAVIWVKGVRFFDPGFLINTALLGFAGLLLYLVLPIAWTIKGTGDHSFFEVLRANWTMQKQFLVAKELRNTALLLALTSALPVVLMGIRWRTSIGDVNAAGSFLTNIAFRSINLFLLVVCLWIVFDPRYSPRALTESKGLPLTFLSFYYLGALAIGYYAGYALLVFTEAPRKGRHRESSIGKLVNPLVRFAVLAAVVAVPAGLIYKNFASVRADNGSILKEFAARMTESLPPAPAYLLADDPFGLTLLRGHLKSTGKGDGYVFVNTGALESPAYQVKLQEIYGNKWPSLGTLEDMGARVPQLDLQAVMRHLAASNVVAYIHPSFGYYFEALYAVPNGQSYRLHPYAPDQIAPPALTPEQVAENEAYWTRNDEYVRKVASLRQKGASLDAAYVSRFYSRSLNTWGVVQQRLGNNAAAGKHFAGAYELNTNNVPARVNSSFNKILQAGRVERLDTGKTLEERFGGYRSWDKLLAENGPFDEPEFCQYLGANLLSQTQFRQAALQFARTIHFEPTNSVARISYVKSLSGGNWLNQAMAELDKIATDFPQLSDAEKVEMANVRASLYFKQNDFATAEKTLKAAQEALPEQGALAESLYELYRAAGQYTNALATINRQLEKTPTNVVIHMQKAELQLGHGDFEGTHQTLDKVLSINPKLVSAQVYHAFVYMQEGKYDRAWTTVDKVLQEDSDNTQALLYRGIAHLEKKEVDEAREAFDELLAKEPQNFAALRNRAILHLGAQRWSEAKDDYKELQKVTPRSYAVMYGLAEIAYAQNKREEATRYYQKYLQYAPAEGGPELAEEKKKVQQRLQELNTPGK